MKFLITGGAGYIGSTVASALEDAGHTPVILVLWSPAEWNLQKAEFFIREILQIGTS
jgi:nucleoside-diphosphate-sugar epimerase